MKHLYILFLLCSWLTQAQHTGSITGIVVDSNGDKVPFANVALYINNTNSVVGGTITDVDGKFDIPDLKDGTYALVISFLGYEPFKRPDIIIEGNNIALGLLQLEEHLTELDEVQVKAQRPAIEQGLGKTTLNVGDDMSSANESAIDLLQYIPSGSTDADGNVLLRGAPATILIDGIPTDLQNALETIPVDAIDKLEIINNPSAKYASQNGAGVINIVLKKENLKGSNGRVGGMLGTPDRQQLNGNVMLQQNKLSSSTNFSYRHHTDENVLSNKRITRSESDSSYLNNNGVSYQDNSRLDIKQKFRYQINKQSAAVLSGTYQKGADKSHSVNEALNYNGDGSLKSHNLSKTIGENNRDYWNLNARYNYDFSKTTNLIVNARHEAQTSHSRSDRLFTFYDTNSGEQKKDYKTQDRFVPEKMKSTRLNIDFEHGFSDYMKIEAGALLMNKSAESDNQFLRIDYKWDETSQDYVTVIDSSQFYVFETSENNVTTYGVLSAHIGKWEIQGGLRYEYIRMEPYSPTNDSGAVNNNHNLLPTFQARHRVSDNFDYGLNYSKRVRMPSYRQLNPMEIYNGLYSKRSGNPLLQPEKIHSVDLNANWRFGMHNIMPSVFYRHHTDVITQFQELIEEDGLEVLHRKYGNIGNSEQMGFELNVSNVFFKKWRFKTNYISYWQSVDNFVDSEIVNFTNWVNNVKLTSDLTFLKSFKWQVTATYESPRNTTTGINYERIFVNTNIRKSLFDNKATLTFRVNDVFDSLERKSENTSSPKFISHNYSKSITRYFAIAFSYKFSRLNTI